MDNIELTTLSVSMYTNKGAYALLLGSGISVPAHIKSGWGIEEELIKKFTDFTENKYEDDVSMIAIKKL